MSKILIIDDDLEICEVLVKRFKKMDHNVHYSLALKQGLDKVFAQEFDIVFLDVNLPDGNGLEAIEIIQDHPFAPEVIIMTGQSDLEGVKLAIKSRAWDYIQKRGSTKEFEFSLIRALEYRQQKQSKIQWKQIKRKSIIGNSNQIKNCLEKILKASNNYVPILLTGETGTGKELFAKAIHENSRQQENNFLVVDCAALPDHLVESVLFGHSKGAFTGADSDKVGLIKSADEGTLFLDEVGELSLDIQKKFLRVLQEKSFRPVGSEKETSSNFRLVAATHRNVPKMVKQGQFREDLYFRIASIEIEIPPLRNRKADIPSLVTYRMDRENKLLNDSSHKPSQEFMENLDGYDWPGNVRELFNTIDYACSDAYQETILFPKHLPEHIRLFNMKNKMKNSAWSTADSYSIDKKAGNILKLKDHIEKAKYDYIRDLLSITQGNINESCKLSGISKGHLYRLLQRYEINTS